MSQLRGFLYGVMTDQVHGFFAVIAKVFLRLLSSVYGVVVRFRNFLYEKGILRSVHLGRPVISIGNITWGGSGKTPMVLLLAGSLKEKGFQPAVLTRGYMANSEGMSPAISDEAEMLRREILDLPVGVGANRLRSSQEVLANNKVDIFILDDGFQHRQVYRDMDIVLVDATNPFGNGALLPRGILREPISSLGRADVIVITRADIDMSQAQALTERLKKINAKALIVTAVHQPYSFIDLVSQKSESSSALQGKKIVAFCSIADSRGFEKTLTNLGAHVIRVFDFPDHHSYSVADIKAIVDFADKEKLDGLVTTAKDEVKILQFKEYLGTRRCWVLKIKMVIQTHHEEFFNRIIRLLGR